MVVSHVTTFCPYQAQDLRLGDSQNRAPSNGDVNGTLPQMERPLKKPRCFQRTGIPEDSAKEIGSASNFNPLSLGLK